MSIKQRTIQKEISISGTGLHTGCKTTVTLKPAEENHGIRFIRVDLPERPTITISPSNIIKNPNVLRCTSIGVGGAAVHTVEHLLSALSGLNIYNLTVEISGEELPGLDGSALEYLQALKKAGVVEQKADLPYFSVREPIGVQEGDSSIYVVPSEEFKISYTLDYNSPLLRSQFVSLVINNETYEKDIAPCRTFCLEKEALELQRSGLGKGANYKNTLVVSERGVVENEFRFKDECARHKILDFIGDLYMLGQPIKGHVFAVKSGHSLNLKLLQKIREQKEKYGATGVLYQYDENQGAVIDIDQIMKILPHRYPFLLVDRVIEIEKGKRAIGIKNVTINDNFFEGHFPAKPIMPGVLMVEAMAQTAGVVVLTNEEHRGKVAFFMAADKVKFRKVVTPGDQLMMHVEVVKDKAKIAQIRAEAKVNNEIVAEAEMVFSFTDASYLYE